MPMYNNFGQNPFDFKTMGKELWNSLQDIDGSKQAEAEEFAKQAAEKQAKFKAAQEKNRLAKEQKVNIFDEPMMPDRTDYEEGVYPRKVVGTKTFPSVSSTSAVDRAKQTKMTINDKTIGNTIGDVIASEDEIKNYYANKGKEPVEETSVAVAEKEAPLSEPVATDAVAPKANIFDGATATAPASASAITEYSPKMDSRGETKGTINNIFDDVRTPALNKLYSNYDLQEKNAQEKRAIIDSVNKNVQKAVGELGEQYDERVKMRNAQNEGGSWSDWLNPLGALQGIGEVFYGKTVYNPETQQYETRSPQNWHDLAQNLFLNMARVGSGFRFSSASNGKGGRSFRVGYDSSLPASIMEWQLKNSKAPFEDWENFRREVNDPHQKPWTIDQEYPVIAHPFEKEAKEAVSDEMKFNNAVDNINRIAAYKGWGPDTPEKAMLENAVLNIDNEGDAIWQFESNLERLNFDPATRKELTRAFALGLHNIKDPEQVRAENALAQAQVNNAHLKDMLTLQKEYDKMEQEGKYKEQELDQKERELQSKIELNRSRANYFDRKDLDGLTFGKDKDGFEVPLDENGEIIPQMSTLDARAEANRLITRANSILQNGTPEEIAEWISEEQLFRKKAYRAYLKDNKSIPLDDVTDKLTGKTTSVGLDSIRSLMEEKALAVVQQALKRQTDIGSTSDGSLANQLVASDYAVQDTANAPQGTQDQAIAMREDAVNKTRQQMFKEESGLADWKQAPGTGQFGKSSSYFMVQPRYGEVALKNNFQRAQILSRLFDGIENWVKNFQNQYHIAPSRERIWEEFKGIADTALTDAEKEAVRFGNEADANRAILEAYLRSKNMM